MASLAPNKNLNWILNNKYIITKIKIEENFINIS